MKSKFVLPAAALVFATGAIVYLQSAQRNSNEPFVVTYARYYQSRPDYVETWVNLVNSSGVKFTKRLDRNGNDIEHFPLQALPPGGWGDRAAFERSRFVIRQDQILGLTAYVMRHDAGGQIIEEWSAPETGSVPLKTIIELGNGETLIVEAVNLEFRQVSDEEMKPRADLLRKHPE